VTLTFLLSLMGIACSGQKYSNIDVQRAVDMIDSPDRPLIIDVRTPQEYNGELGNIPGSRLISLQVLQDSIAALSDFKAKDIVMVCRSGNRSRTAGQMMVEAGFEKIYNLEGGMKAWNAYHQIK